MNQWVIASRRLSPASLERRFPQATIVDVTSRGPDPWVRFSPFFPHGGLPVPGHPSWLSASVEGAWQGLKVFERAGVDRSKLTRETMSGLKRSARSLGPCRGHEYEGMLLGYRAARQKIYCPLYRYVLEHHLVNEVERLRELGARGDLVLLDYETNEDLKDLTRPLSHAGLVLRWLRGTWPGEDSPATTSTTLPA